jgi:hypothetical protein
VQPSVVFVTNTNPKVHTDRYNGEEFFFPPNKQVMVPIAAAAHMLGYGMKDKTAILHRTGRAFRQDPETGAFVDDGEGAKWLAKFIFETAVMQPASALQQALAELPAPQTDSAAKLAALL